MLLFNDSNFSNEIKNYYRTLALLNNSKYVFAVNPDNKALSQAKEVTEASNGRSILIEVYARPLKGQSKVNYTDVANTVRLLREEYSNYSNVSIGVGTQDDPRGTQKCISAGAQFVVAHVFMPQVLKVCANNFIPCVLGCQTATEITACLNLYKQEYPYYATEEDLNKLGVDPNKVQYDEVWVKLFPAEACKASYLQYVNTLLGRGIKVLVAGGVDLGPKTENNSSMNIGDVMRWPLVKAVTLSRMSKGPDGKSEAKPGEIKSNMLQLIKELDEDHSN